MSLALAFATIDRPELAQRLIRSVRAHFPDLPIYAADQSQTIEPMRGFYELNKVNVIRVPYDCGVAAARNAAVAAISADYFVLCDDDMLVIAESGFSDAVAVLNACSQIGVVGGKLYDVVGASVRVRHWEHYFEYNRRHRLLSQIPIYYLAPRICRVGSTKVYMCDSVMNFAVFRRSIFSEIIKWDERFTCNGEHEDFYLNLKVNSDIEVAYLPTMVGYHHHPPELRIYEARLRERGLGWLQFFNKWNLEQQLEDGRSVRSIDDITRLYTLEQAQRRFFFNQSLSLRAVGQAIDPVGESASRYLTMANIGMMDEDRAVSVGWSPGGMAPDHTILSRGQPGWEAFSPWMVSAPDGTRSKLDPIDATCCLFVRYRPFVDEQVRLWYAGSRRADRSRRVAVYLRWYSDGGRLLVWESDERVVELANAATWTPLVIDVPCLSPNWRHARFEVIGADEGDGERLCQGYLVNAPARLFQGGPVTDEFDVLALSRAPAGAIENSDLATRSTDPIRPLDGEWHRYGVRLLQIPLAADESSSLDLRRCGLAASGAPDPILVPGAELKGPRWLIVPDQPPLSENKP